MKTHRQLIPKSNTNTNTNTNNNESTTQPNLQRQRRGLCGNGEEDVFDDLENDDEDDLNANIGNTKTTAELNSTKSSARQRNIDFQKRRQNIRGCSRVLFSTDEYGSMEEIGGNNNNNSNNNNPDSFEDDINEVEASTIRGMIQKAVGVAFIRSNKVVFGVSISGGSGIVLARLSDGTWSAPSLIAMAGMGFGIQIGVEVANYIFILQSKEALEHFQHGGSFTLGGNVGVAFAGMGREAIGAASVSSAALCGINTSSHTPIHQYKEDEYNYDIDEEELLLYDNNNSIEYEVDTKTGQRIPTRKSSSFRRRGGRGRNKNGLTGCGRVGSSTRCGGRRSSHNAHGGNEGNEQNNISLTISSLLLNKNNIAGVAPIVAYAKSEGLYVGVSLEGSRIYTRNDMNEKVYKYSSYNHKIVSARDILTGKIISRPKEAEYLYSLLHTIELAYDISCLPSLPKNSKLLFNGGNGGGDWTRSWDSSSPPYLVGDGINTTTSATSGDNEVEDDIDEYYKKFQDFLFGGITVLRISPRSNRREQRTLWLQTGAGGAGGGGEQQQGSSSVRIGFVSKLYSATAQSKHLSASIIQDVSPPTNNNSNSNSNYNNNHLHHNNFNKNGGNEGGAGGGGASIISEMDGDDLTLDSCLLVRTTNLNCCSSHSLVITHTRFGHAFYPYSYVNFYFFIISILFHLFVGQSIPTNDDGDTTRTCRIIKEVIDGFSRCS